jgi:hypothetical protein
MDLHTLEILSHYGLQAILEIALLSPLLLPVVMVFYAMWREDVTRGMVLAFAVAEVLSFPACYWALCNFAYIT